MGRVTLESLSRKANAHPEKGKALALRLAARRRQSVPLRPPPTPGHQIYAWTPPSSREPSINAAPRHGPTQHTQDEDPTEPIPTQPPAQPPTHPGPSKFPSIQPTHPHLKPVGRPRRVEPPCILKPKPADYKYLDKYTKEDLKRLKNRTFEERLRRMEEHFAELRIRDATILLRKPLKIMKPKPKHRRGAGAPVS